MTKEEIFELPVFDEKGKKEVLTRENIDDYVVVRFHYRKLRCDENFITVHLKDGSMLFHCICKIYKKKEYMTYALQYPILSSNDRFIPAEKIVEGTWYKYYSTDVEAYHVIDKKLNSGIDLC